MIVNMHVSPSSGPVLAELARGPRAPHASSVVMELTRSGGTVAIPRHEAGHLPPRIANGDETACARTNTPGDFQSVQQYIFCLEARANAVAPGAAARLANPGRRFSRLPSPRVFGFPHQAPGETAGASALFLPPAVHPPFVSPDTSTLPSSCSPSGTCAPADSCAGTGDSASKRPTPAGPAWRRCNSHTSHQRPAPRPRLTIVPPFGGTTPDTSSQARQDPRGTRAATVDGRAAGIWVARLAVMLRNLVTLYTPCGRPRRRTVGRGPCSPGATAYQPATPTMQMSSACVFDDALNVRLVF